MYRRSVLRIAIAITICAALLPLPGIASLVSEAAQGQSEDRKGKPRPGSPEGVLPNLNEIRSQPQIDHEAPPPIPSTIPSKRNSGKPWDGRRVGDPEPPERLNPANRTARGSAGSNSGTKLTRNNKTLRAHARARMNAAPPVPDNQFVQNFFTWALTRNPLSNETNHWYDQLRVAYGQGQTSLKSAGIELGRTLFQSAEYGGRNRDAHEYVYDLYKTYLMRDPDPGGWSTWEGVVSSHGREYVRRGFEESGEFATIAANLTPNGSSSTNAASLITAQVDRRNQPGNGLLTRDANWSLPLLSLPGRAGLDLGLVLSYSSQVWTVSDPYIYFDEDNGSPSPGFRLGFPTVQRKVFDAQNANNAYMFITGSGQRVELRQVGTSNIYDAGDSSYLRLTENGPTLLVYSTDGTKLTFSEANGEYRCVEIKDRNGNYITVNYNTLGQITTITDTLSRVITFNYDIYNNLLSITQPWGAQTRQWATFGWTSHTMHPSFGSLRVVGTADNAVLPLLMQVGLPDGARYNFEYTNAAQVSVIRHYRSDNAQTFYTVYQYESTTTDCPRLSQTRVSAENWTDLNGVPGEVTTYFAVDPDGACRMTAPDNTVYKEYYGTGWQKGLTTLSEVWVGTVKKKWTTTAWTQDNTSVSWEVNPRVTETNTYDGGGNRRRTVIDYGPYASWGLPYIVKDYAADGTTEIRHTFYDYNLSQAYLDRRIIGLVSAIHMTNISSWQLKVGYTYDDPARLQATPTLATQHDTSYNTSFTARGNLTAVSRWDVTDIVNPAKALTAYTNYYTTGTTKSTTDPVGHQSSISYDDSFSDNVNRNTFAYPTTLIDADGFSSTMKYNFNFGGQTRTQGPPPAGQPQGAIQTVTYDSLGRVERTTTESNGAYTRYVYGLNYVQSFSTVNNIADEAYSIKVFDGMGRIIASAGNHPGSTGGYRAQMTIYDLMGRAIKTSNPAEITGAWVPAGDDAAGWLYTQQTYDWKGRPLRTTHPDTQYKEAAYSGCGCAGGEVVTLTDEGTIDGGVAKRRQQRIYSDVLGRTVKTEVLNWQGSNSVYSTTVKTYNARDQVLQVREYAGAEGSGTYQDTAMTYDGLGRLKTKHVPQQNPGTSTTWDYFDDDTIQKITDARGATQNFTYNSRHLPTNISYTAPASSEIFVPATTTYSYDAAGNRTLMSDGLGTVSYNYDQMSRITSETRHFNELTAYPGAGNYTLTYQYNLADVLTTLAMPSQVGGTLSYAYDSAGRLTSLTGSGFGTTTQFVTAIQYRAWGAAKHAAYGDNSTLNVTYNNRLLALRHELSNMKPTGGPATIMGSQNQYYADGMVRYTQDLQDGNFDRGYEYDHVGRIKEALSGREARGLPALSYPDNPFRQSYTYDVWDNMKRPFNRHWSANLPDTPTYTNDRRSDATYDAEGNVLLRDNERKQHAYDAAGRQRYFLQQEWGLPQFAYERNTIDITFDGDGRPGKRFTNRYTEDYEESPWNEPNNLYYVRSTVLGGAPIVEYMPVGYGTSVNIYIGNQKVAERFPDSGYVQWRHVNPATGSWLLTYPSAGSATTIRSELDPLGTEVGTGDPYVSHTSYQDMIGLDSLYEERGNPFDPGGGCGTLDGLPISCSELRMRMQGGTVASEFEVPETRTIRAPHLNGRGSITYTTILTREQKPIVDHGIGLYMTLFPVIRGGRVAPGTNNEGYYLDWEDGLISLPQDPTPEELLKTGKTEAESRMKIDSCAKFFGGTDKGVKALNSLNFAVDPSMPESGRPQAVLQGNNVRVNPHRGSSGGGGLVTPDGVGHTFILVERAKNAMSIRTMTLYGAEARAFGQLHETAHKAKRFGSTDNDSGPQRVMNGYENNFKIWKACFSSTPTQPWRGEPPLIQ